MAYFASSPDRRGAAPPEVARPNDATWRELTAEGIRWEGQALLVGGAQDLPVRIILTDERLALVANGDIALDIPRSWLRPEPKLVAENGVRLFVTPDGGRSGSDDTQPMLLRARAGRGAAAQLVALLTGRRLPVEQGREAQHIVAELPAWKTTVGAATPVALPPLPDSEELAPRQQAWPPVEQEGVASRPRPRSTSTAAGDGSARTSWRSSSTPTSTSIAAWADRHLAPEPDPVPTADSRRARRQGTLADGVTVSDEVAMALTPRQAAEGGRRGIVWALRAAILLILVGTAAWFGRDHLAIDMDTIRDRLPADVQRTLGIAEEEPEVAQTTGLGSDTGSSTGATTGDGTEGASTSGQTAVEAAALQTEEALGVGGTTSPLPTAGEDEATGSEDANTEMTGSEDTGSTEGDDGTGGQGGVPEDPTASQDEVEVVPTTEPTPEPTEEIVPTDQPAEPTPEPTPEPTVEPTMEPTPEPTIEPTLEPTVEPTQEPTPEPSATTEPTEPSTPTPSETPEATETVAPTETATETPAPTPAIEPQAPSVEPETTPEQAVVADGFRYTIEGTSVGETVEELPEINSVGGYGEWVVLNVYGENMSGTEQVFDMSSFRLFADGQEVLVDVGNAWVNGLVGNTPAYGNTDAILWASGEGHRFVLTFLAPPGAQHLVLQAGDQQIDLTPVLENATPLLDVVEAPAPSDLVQGTVVQVIDAETILVDIDGQQVTVRYLGVDVPDSDSCFGADATQANSDLVAGKTVTLERQATDVDARGNWVRDVWVETDDGQPVLVSQQMVAQGAATADISVPNTRFAGWLTAAQVSAEANDAGLWGACGESAVAAAPIAWRNPIQ